MITTVVIEKVEDGVPPPTGNGFSVCVHEVYGSNPWRVDTGLSLKIPKGYPLRLESVDNFFVTGWMLRDGRLWVLVEPFRGAEDFPIRRPIKKDRVATAWIGEYERVPLRFIERSPSGGRIVRGDAQVVDCTENRDAESGE